MGAPVDRRDLTFDDAVAALKSRLSWRDNPYFQALQAGTFTRDDFVETQVQFLFAVVFFSRPMGVLAARLPKPDLRLNLLRNVWEEHGSGDLGASHQATFLALLDRLGVAAEEVEHRALWPEVRAFNTALAGLCMMDDPVTGLATLGFIEDLFAGISAFLGQRIVDRGWLHGDQIVHYTLHEKLDEVHAEEFYVLLRPLWDKPRHRYQIEQGLALGGYLFLRLYRDLYEARARRSRRQVEGPHSQMADGWSSE